MSNIAQPAPSLTDIRLFADVDADVLGELEKNGRQLNFDPGETIIERGDPGQDVYFLLSGRVHVMNVAASGRVVAFAALEAGEIFGELSALDGRDRSATVVAALPCTVATVSGPQFCKLITSDPAMSLTLLQRLAYIIRMCDDRIFNLSSLGAAQRLCLEILRLSRPDPGSSDHWIVYPIPTHAVLAGTVGTARETVARIIRRLSTDGIVERKAKSLYIRDRRRLEAEAMFAVQE